MKIHLLAVSTSQPSNVFHSVLDPAGFPAASSAHNYYGCFDEGSCSISLALIGNAPGRYSRHPHLPVKLEFSSRIAWASPAFFCTNEIQIRSSHEMRICSVLLAVEEACLAAGLSGRQRPSFELGQVRNRQIIE